MPIAATKDNLKLNDFLVQRRKFMRIRFGELENKTGIPAKHLKKIEKGEWCDLPSGVYVKGFLKRYAQTVGLDEAELALRYENEWKQLCAVPQFDVPRPRSGRFDFLRNISLRYAIIGAMVAIIVGYVSWQFKVILARPDLNLNYPQEENFTAGESKMELAGLVSAGAVLTLNGEPIYAEESGLFKKEVELLNGLNVFEIKAVSRFGKETKVVRRVTFNP